MRVPILMLGVVVLASGCSEKRFRENGSSAMSPTIQPNETIVADMSAFDKGQPRRFDVVVFHPPPKPQEIWVMRVIGLPGESLEIRDDGLHINGTRVTQPSRLTNIRHAAGSAGSLQPQVTYPYAIPPGTYFVVGDNTTDSFDSRFWGAVPRHSILGRVKNK